MSFGRRLALFFMLIAIVPTAALIAILLFVSHDAQRGKTDARIASGLQTALAVYGDQVDQAKARAAELGRERSLATALHGKPSDRERWTQQAAHQLGLVRVEVRNNAGDETAAAGQIDSVAFGQVALTRDSSHVGTLRVSTTTGSQYVTEVKHLTQRDLVLRHGDQVLAETVSPPRETLASGKTTDLTIGGTDFRAHEVSLNASDGESLLILGPKEGSGIFGLGRAAVGIMIWFLVTALALAWALARALTRLHQRVETQAITDPLTGLWNRRYMAETLERELAGATALGERLASRQRETEVPRREGGAMQVTLSIGVATVPDSADDLEGLVDAADRALLRAKRAGKNQLRAAPAMKARPSADEPRHRAPRGRLPTRRR